MFAAMSAPPIFDETAFRILRAELGADGAAEILQTFLSDTSTKLDVMAANGLDRSMTRRQAHSIKSSAATLGFLELSGIARELELELGARGANPEQLHQAAETLREAFGKVFSFAETVLREQAWRV
jgi:HPt (histidine-containing phosphotransfer) domain-containing protein